MLLAERCEDLGSTELRIVHRLDRETSGVILFGKGRGPAAAWRRSSRRAKCASATSRSSMALPSRIDSRSTRRSARSRFPDPQSDDRSRGRAPRADPFRVLRRGPEHALVVARPAPGDSTRSASTSAMRVSRSSGDKVYGLDPELFLRFVGGKLSERDRDRLLWRRQALHAWSLTIRHPGDGRRMTLRAGTGSAWNRLAERLGIGSA